MGFEPILANIQSTITFIAVLSILIIVHEWGHFITAKRLGVKVEKFSVGFGRKLYSRTYNGTEFMICLIPLGGYVKMAGDERNQCRGTPEEFHSKSPGHRALIVLNGPVVNFILAYICLYFVFVLGYPDLSPRIGELMDGYPAQEAGFLVGDEVVRVDSKNIVTWSDLQRTITTTQKDQVVVDFIRDGQPQSKILIPQIEKTTNIFGQEQEIRLIGIRPAEEIVTFKYGLGASFKEAYKKLSEITILTYKSLYFMATGSMSPKESVTGPIGIFYVVKSAAEMGFSHLLFIMGVISASLAIFNLLPVIPLDGGHLFLLGIERIRGRALPKNIDEMIAKTGFSLIILLALFVFYSDFARFGWIEKFQSFFQ